MRKEDRLGVQTGAAAKCWVSFTPSSASRSILGVLSKPHTNILVKTVLTGIPALKCVARTTSVFLEGFTISCIWCLAEADGPTPKTTSMSTCTEDHLLQKVLSPRPRVLGCSPTHCMHSHHLSPLPSPKGLGRQKQASLDALAVCSHKSCAPSCFCCLLSSARKLWPHRAVSLQRWVL